ncbi:MAG TPA: helix-turn-helix transcriptional regulator [Longimicrobiales bacterium]
MNSSIPLAPRDLLVMSALADGPLHGYGIIKAVEEECGPLLDPGNLYRVLRRMRRDGWVEDAPAAEGGGEGEQNRRRYRLTPRGRAVLRAEVERLEGVLSRVRPALAGRRGRTP